MVMSLCSLIFCSFNFILYWALCSPLPLFLLYRFFPRLLFESKTVLWKFECVFFLENRHIGIFIWVHHHHPFQLDADENLSLLARQCRQFGVVHVQCTHAHTHTKAPNYNIVYKNGLKELRAINNFG